MRTAVVVLGVVVLVSACASTSSPPPSATEHSVPEVAPTSSNAQAPQWTITDAVDAATKVDWGSARTVSGMTAGLPNPGGWYAAVFGPGRSQSGLGSAGQGSDIMPNASASERTLYITFDDGPSPQYTIKILRILASHDAQATFFLLGGNSARNPALVDAIARDGHAIANHTYAHPELDALGAVAIEEQLLQTQERLGPTAGSCMRPPYGLLGASAASTVVDHLGFLPVFWTAHADEWNNPSIDTMVERMRQATRPGAVVLLHDGGGDRSKTVELVRRMVPEWTDQGYSLRAIPVCETARD